jgi:hypothetical protein
MSFLQKNKGSRPTMNFIKKINDKLNVTSAPSISPSATATMLKIKDKELILTNLDNAEQKFEGYVAYLKKTDDASNKKTLVWAENVLGDLRSLISLIVDKKRHKY